jgi:methylenetetrahydrofolate reductase (NADPH)
MNETKTVVERFAFGKPLFSVEFFPPRDDTAGERMLRAAQALQSYEPDFVSITYGAGGGTRATTLKYARMLKEQCGFEVMPHLTCVGHKEAELMDILRDFESAGFRNVMALRGDPPKGETSFQAMAGGFSHADELVRLIRRNLPNFGIGVAGYPEKHPESPEAGDDVQRLAHKVSCGADFVTTQLFFDNEFYFDFVRRCRQAGIEVPILPGLLPVLSLAQIRRFSSMCGAALPAELEKRLEEAGEDGAQEVGADWAYEQIKGLLDGGAPGFHLYALNKSKATTSILERLRDRG